MSEFKVLISDPLPDDAVDILTKGGRIDVITEQKDFEKHLSEIHGWIVRSGTKISGSYLEATGQLTCICRAGAGVDNIDLDAATQRGVVVMNTPDANSTAAAEHTVALLLTLARNIPFAHATMAGGGWGRSGFVGTEVDGKRVGIVGLGKIGRIVAHKLQALGLSVCGVDPFLSADVARTHGIELMSLEDVLPSVDFLTLHVPFNDSTRGLISTTQLECMKRGAFIVNCSRGGVVDEPALLAALETGRIGGAALDVYSEEPPPSDSPLRNHPRIVTTPHLGASTREAQKQVALTSASQVRDYLLHGSIVNSVNAVSLSGEKATRYAPLATLGRRLGSLHAQLLDGQPGCVTVELEERLVEEGIDRLVVDSVLTGFLESVTEGQVNAVNARLLATRRGISVAVKGRSRGDVYTHSVRVDIAGDGYERSLEGAVVWGDSLRIVRIDR